MPWAGEAARQGETAGVLTQVGAGPAGAGHDDFRSFAPGQFENEGAVKVQRVEFFHKRGPIDAPVAGGEMVVGVSFVVMDMEQAEVRAHFGNQ